MLCYGLICFNPNPNPQYHTYMQVSYFSSSAFLGLFFNLCVLLIHQLAENKELTALVLHYSDCSKVKMCHKHRLALS